MIGTTSRTLGLKITQGFEIIVNRKSFSLTATQQTITCSKSTTETLQKGVKYVQN